MHSVGFSAVVCNDNCHGLFFFCGVFFFYFLIKKRKERKQWKVKTGRNIIYKGKVFLFV